MISKLFFSLWKFSLSCWACKVICEDCFFSVMSLSCDKKQHNITTQNASTLNEAKYCSRYCRCVLLWSSSKVNKSKFSGWVREKVSFYEIQFMWDFCFPTTTSSLHTDLICSSCSCPLSVALPFIEISINSRCLFYYANSISCLPLLVLLFLVISSCFVLQISQFCSFIFMHNLQ